MKKFKVITRVFMTYLVEAKDHDEARDIVHTGEIDVWDSEIIDDDVREISEEVFEEWRKENEDDDVIKITKYHYSKLSKKVYDTDSIKEEFEYKLGQLESHNEKVIEK